MSFKPLLMWLHRNAATFMLIGGTIGAILIIAGVVVFFDWLLVHPVVAFLAIAGAIAMTVMVLLGFEAIIDHLCKEYCKEERRHYDDERIEEMAHQLPKY